VVAYLEYLKSENRGKTFEPIPIEVGVTTFGNESSEASINLNDNGISLLHARLDVKGEENSWLFDEGSIAGTWINYQPVSPEGNPVHHGDIIHIGRIGFRYKLSNKDRIPKPIILSVEHHP
jgi:pSer/pThr/pTyr-binding forkhead associated (FHA) protein